MTIDLHCFIPKKMGNLMIPVVLKIGENSEWKTWTPTSLIWFQWEMLGLLLLEGFRIHSLKSFGAEMGWGRHFHSSYGRFLLRYRYTQKNTQKKKHRKPGGRIEIDFSNGKSRIHSLSLKNEIHPWKLTAGTYKSANWKGKSSSKAPFLGSMWILQGVSK